MTAHGRSIPLSLLFALSTRNLFRHRRRNIMLLLAISVAVAGVALTNSLIRGFQADMRDAAVDNLTGHIKVLAPGYRDDPGIDRRFHVPADWSAALSGMPVAGWAPRIRVPAVLMSERETRGIQLVGIDPSREDISFVGDVAVRGERLADVEDGRLLLGKALAAQLRTDLGYRLVVMAQGADGLNREAGFRVVGLFDGEGTGLEKAFVFTGLERLQALLGTTAVTEIAVRLDDDESDVVDTVVRRLQEVFPAEEVLRWEALEPQAAAMFEYADMAIFIWFLILMSALVFGLVNALVTAVMERTRELGMLRAVGMRPGTVVMQVVLESSIIMAAGVAVGLLFGGGLVWWLRDGIDLSAWSEGVELAGMRSILVPRLLAADVALVTGMSLMFGVLASLYPAWRAVKIKPLEAMQR